MSSSLLEKVRIDVQDFFNLPMEEKKRFWQFPGEVEGFGQPFVVSEEQQLDWADLFFITTQPIHSRKPHLFPNLPRPFRSSILICLSPFSFLYFVLYMVNFKPNFRIFRMCLLIKNNFYFYFLFFLSILNSFHFFQKSCILNNNVSKKIEKFFRDKHMVS